jgi:hypothetical protein
MFNTDNCSTILNPKYKGECLGVNIGFFLYGHLTSWTPYFWRQNVLERMVHLRDQMLETGRRMLEVQGAKAIEGCTDPDIRMQQHTLLQYCHTQMEQCISTKFVALFDTLKIDVSSIISSICAELLHLQLLSRSLGMRGIKQYHKVSPRLPFLLPPSHSLMYC